MCEPYVLLRDERCPRCTDPFATSKICFAKVENPVVVDTTTGQTDFPEASVFAGFSRIIKQNDYFGIARMQLTTWRMATFFIAALSTPLRGEARTVQLTGRLYNLGTPGDPLSDM